MSFTFSNGLAAIRVQSYGMFLNYANDYGKIFQKNWENMRTRVGEGSGLSRNMVNI